MIPHFFTKLLVIALFVIPVALNIYSNRISFGLSQLTSPSAAMDISATKSNLQVGELPVTHYFDRYVWKKDRPIEIEAIKDSRRAYVNIKLRFRVDDLEGYPNLFQTADANNGIRMEIAGGTVGVVIPDVTQPNRLRSLTLITDLRTGAWHTLEVEALNGVFVRAAMDGQAPAIYRSRTLSFQTSDIKIGGGFDASRPFHGELADIYVTTGNFESNIGSPSSNHHKIQRLFNMLQFGLLIAAIFILPLAFREHREKFMLAVRNAPLAQSRWRIRGGPWIQSATADGSLNPAFWPVSDRGNDDAFVRPLTISIILIPLLLYQYFYVNAYYTITEGWFSTYASMIRMGQVPYLDFPLLLPPLYPLTIAAFQSIFGAALAPLHFFGIVITCAIAFALYALLRGGFSRNISAFAAVIGAIYYQSGVAYFGYDFTQFQTLYLLLAGLFIAIYARRIVAGLAGRENVILCFGAGVVMACAILTKHSNGGVCSIVLIVATTITMTSAGNWKARLLELTSMGLGGVLPIAAVLWWLWREGALGAFLENVFADALSAKGDASVVFSNAATSFIWGGLIVKESIDPIMYLVIVILLVMTIALVLSFATLAKSEWANSLTAVSRYLFAVIRRPPAANARFFLAMTCALCMIIFLAYSDQCIPCSQNAIGMTVERFAIVSAAVLYIIGVFITLLILLFWIRTTAAYWFIVFMLGVGLMLGSGTSAGLSEISAFLGVSIILAALIRIAIPLTVPALIPAGIALAFAALLIDAKFSNPYAWWGASVGDIRGAECAQPKGVLEHLCVGKPEYEVISRVVDIIRANSRADEPIYVFPHAPIFYTLSGRLPFKGAVVSWFDFMSDRIARQVTTALVEDTPPVLIVVEIPESAIVGHERLFRGGKESGQRAILRSIANLESAGKIAEVYTADVSNLGIRVFVRNKKQGT